MVMIMIMDGGQMPDSWLANSFNAAQQDRKKSDVQAANGRKTRRQCQDPRLRHRTGICTRRSTTEALVVVAIALFCLDNYTSTTRNAHALMARPCQGRAQVTTTSSRMSFSAGERVALAARRAGTHPTDGDDDNPVEDLVVAALKRPVLAQITPDGVCSSDASAAQLLHSVEKAVAGGVTLVQLRDYKSDLESKVNLAKHLRHVTVGSPSLFVINLADGDASWARTAGADGVHLPERNIGLLTSLRDSSASVRPVWPLVAGCSVHSVHAALEAASLGADYVQVGTMFATMSHPGKEPEGVQLISDVRRLLDSEGLGGVFVIGVGGIDAENCGSVMAAGADGVAAIRCLCGGDRAEREAKRLMISMRENMRAVGSTSASISS